MLLNLRAFIYVTAICCLSLIAQADSDSNGVVILVNSKDPGSVRIGKHYAEARGIPERNIIALPLSLEETISLDVYVDTICNPLLAHLIEDGWVDGVQSAEKDRYGRRRMLLVQHRIRYLVLIRGVPLRISDSPEVLTEAELNLPKQFQVTRGSVDGELSLLLGSPSQTMAALVKNPLFNQPNSTSSDAQRVIKVSRLDGPSEASVVSLIDRTMEAEAVGLVGRAYFDLGGPHKAGDQWMQTASEFAKAAYFDVEIENTSREIDFTDRIDAPAIYIGWYQANAYGPWRAPQWQVPLGAIGMHLHSFSAVTVRSATRAWLGAMVEQGFCATVGNVYEPYLQYTHRFDMILHYLLQGHSFGDAVTWSNPGLSWQGVAIGDPLYRPFIKDFNQQEVASMATPARPYYYIRKALQITEADGADAALDYIRAAFVKEPSLVLSHWLGKRYLEMGQSSKAMDAFRLVGYISRFSMDEWVIAQEIADLMSANGHPEAAFEIYEKLINSSGVDTKLMLKLLERGIKIASAANAHGAVANWSSRLISLQAK